MSRKRSPRSRSAFRDALRRKPGQTASLPGRRWVFVPYDQLTDAVGPLAEEPPEKLGIVLVETAWKGRRRAYHKQKLALVLANLRHFALEQAERGVAVHHVAGDAPYADLLEPVIEERGPLRMMEPAEYELRTDLAPLVEKGAIEVLPNQTWMTTPAQFEAAFAGGKSWRMDGFYRRVRRDSGLLMEDGKPTGGKFSFDAENRKRWRGDPPAPPEPQFVVDEIKREVVALVEDAFGDHPGRLDVESLPATRDDAEALWAWAKASCLASFGPYQDAMSVQSRTLFHTRISALLNNGRLLPGRVVREAADLDIPLSSKEGFIRQILGWREFMRHVHYATDGFRKLPDGRSPNVLETRIPLPPAYWGKASGLFCLDRVVEEVWDTGFGHHITRLMVLSNLATLVGADPRELSDWFWVAYVDAYDWVVEPNVLGMGTYSLGDLFVTKPYVSGAAYINRMSDYCGACSFSPTKNCPVTHLYWNFLERNKKRLDDNPRIAMPLRSLAKRSDEQRAKDREVSRRAIEHLKNGDRLHPDDLGLGER